MPQAKPVWGSFYFLISEPVCLAYTGLPSRHATIDTCPLAHMLMEMTSAYRRLAAWAHSKDTALGVSKAPLHASRNDPDPDLANAASVGHGAWNGRIRLEAKMGQDVLVVHWHAILVLEVGGLDHVSVGNAHWSGSCGLRLAESIEVGFVLRLISKARLSGAPEHNRGILGLQGDLVALVIDMGGLTSVGPVLEHGGGRKQLAIGSGERTICQPPSIVGNRIDGVGVGANWTACNEDGSGKPDEEVGAEMVHCGIPELEQRKGVPIGTPRYLVLLDLLGYNWRNDCEAISLGLALIGANKLALGDLGDIVQVGVDGRGRTRPASSGECSGRGLGEGKTFRTIEEREQDSAIGAFAKRAGFGEGSLRLLHCIFPADLFGSRGSWHSGNDRSRRFNDRRRSRRFDDRRRRNNRRLVGVRGLGGVLTVGLGVHGVGLTRLSGKRQSLPTHRQCSQTDSNATKNDGCMDIKFRWTPSKNELARVYV
jgi:hypothetical protein